MDIEVTLKEYAPAVNDNVVYSKQCRAPQLSTDDASSRLQVYDGKKMAVIINNDGIECVSLWDPSDRTVSSDAAEEQSDSSTASIHEENKFGCFSACTSSDETEVCNNTSQSKAHANTSNTINEMATFECTNPNAWTQTNP